MSSSGQRNDNSGMINRPQGLLATDMTHHAPEYHNLTHIICTSQNINNLLEIQDVFRNKGKIWSTTNVILGVPTTSLNIYYKKRKQSQPYHANKEEKCVANVPSSIADHADDQRTQEATRLVRNRVQPIPSCFLAMRNQF